MAVKVIIERRLKEGKEGELAQLLRQLRAKALLASGYISGQTLRSVDDPRLYLVISTWKSLEDWRNWEKDSERNELQRKIDELLEEPAKFRIFYFV
ncbi:MAG: antibiotic biosynthesis monooxygenase [Deltaproteobacteria bacterium]|nr:MAG: antibiotic biosynthesis monooxygenase [Deltaproteobacteria bacterium]